MPDYQPAEHGVSMSYAQMEAAAIAPVTRAMLNTFELYHPLSGRHRFCNDNQSFFGVLEDAAPEDAGELVEFLAAPLTINEPDESDSAASPEISLSLDGVAGAMAARLELTRESLVPWVLTERVYASDDNTGPAILPPTELELSSVGIKGSAVILKANFGDPANVSIPRLTFRRGQYPGLQR